MLEKSLQRLRLQKLKWGTVRGQCIMIRHGVASPTMTSRSAATIWVFERVIFNGHRSPARREEAY